MLKGDAYLRISASVLDCKASIARKIYQTYCK